MIILKSKISDENLENAKTIIDKEYKRDEFVNTIIELGFDDIEVRTAMEYAAIIKPEDTFIKGPIDITVDSRGNVYIPDYYNNRIQKFDPEGNFITKWGSFGSDPGEFNGPEVVAIDQEGNVYVMDRGNYRIQKFAQNPDYKPE